MLIDIPEDLLTMSQRCTMADILAISAHRVEDSYVTNALTEHNPEGTADLLDGMLDRVSGIAEVALQPVATWSRVYRHGATLQEHTDREGLHWAVSICMRTDHDWPLECFIDGEWQSFSVPEGMGIVTHVRRIPHRRRPFAGKLYVALLLHYREASDDG